MDSMALLLTYSKDMMDVAPQVCGEMTGYPYQIEWQAERAGRAFHEWICRHEIAAEDSASSDGESSVEKLVTDGHAHHHHGESSLADKNDYYACLGLGHLRWKATEEQIRRAYRRLVLKYHPDKNVGEVPAEEEDEDFKVLQKAYDVLYDLRKRRQYDSQDAFDDTIPADAEPKDFYATFGPVFERNGRWSTVQPVPELGGDDATPEHVNEFYNFWFEFKSWREFPGEDEHNLDEAECREEKRWMERENERARAKLKKDEMKRIGRLIDLGIKYDPRVKRQREAEKEAKKARKNAGKNKAAEEEAERQRQLKEAEEKAAEEAKAAAEVAKKEKAQREKEKKLLRKAKARLRAAADGKGWATVSEVEEVCTALGEDVVPGTARLNALCDVLEAPGCDGAALKQKLADVRNGVVDDSAAEAGGAAADAAAAAAEKAAAEAARLKAEKEAAAAAAEAAAAAAQPWTEKELALLQKGLRKYPAGAHDRWGSLAEYIGTRTAAEVVAQVKQKDARTAKPTSAVVAPAAPATPKSPADAAVSPAAADDDKSDTQTPKAGGGVDPALGAAGWSSAQQKALERAISIVPAALPPADRWAKIADMVQGKTVKECLARYKFLAQQLKAAKKATQ